MNRRDFFKSLFSAPLAVALAPLKVTPIITSYEFDKEENRLTIVVPADRVDDPSFLSVGTYSYEFELVEMTFEGTIGA